MLPAFAHPVVPLLRVQNRLIRSLVWYSKERYVSEPIH